MAPPKKHATEFEKIIKEGRERKQNEALAARIFKREGGNRRSSAPPTLGPLASRAGVQKRQSSGRIPAGDINSGWAHDLHDPASKRAYSQSRPNALAARIRAPGTPIPTNPKPKGNRRDAHPNRSAQLANAYERTNKSASNVSQQINHVRGPQATQGITIRGLAGPFVVMAQNFAPGTTAADIESAMTPVGGLITSCRMVKVHPIVIAEIVLENREAADRIIAEFNNSKADGRTLHVYLKPGGYSRPLASTPTGPRAERDQQSRTGKNIVVDGSMGFDDDVMITDSPADGAADGVSSIHSSSRGGLYSDNLVSSGNGGGNNGRRGRGYAYGR